MTNQRSVREMYEIIKNHIERIQNFTIIYNT